MDFLGYSSDNLHLFPSIILYTEMHYRFKLTGSRYFKKEPEILADAPRKVKLNSPIPLMLLVKDADKYPVFLENVEIKLKIHDEPEIRKVFDIHQHISDHYRSQTIELDRPAKGERVTIFVCFNYQINGKKKSCINHNLALLPRSPLIIQLLQSPVPGKGKILWGDLHYHSHLTEDMVEFGAPLLPSKNAAKAMGLSFFCVTDHSYDLDDLPGSWRETDPMLQKWTQSRKKIDSVNKSDSSCVIIPSEEVTVRNSKGRNIHALVLNNSSYIPGSGDGAENFFSNRSEHTVKELSMLTDDASLVMAAHPITPTPFLQWLLIKRGVWEKEDCLHAHIPGFQIINGSRDSGFNRGKAKWLMMLRSGYHKFVYAGNDAHGNFNQFRQIKTPMLSLWEKDEQLFGEWKTGVVAEDNSVSSIINALRLGKCIISDGPFLAFNISSKKRIYNIGENCPNLEFTLHIDCESSVDFGEIKSVIIFQGFNGVSETCLKTIIPDNTIYNYHYSQKITGQSSGYYRVELITQSPDEQHFAMTNPIWVDPDYSSRLI